MVSLTNLFRNPAVIFLTGTIAGGLIFYFVLSGNENKISSRETYFGKKYSCTIESINPNFDYEVERNALESKFDSLIKSGGVYLDTDGNFQVKYNNRFIVDLKCKSNKTMNF
ncbi:hypothetical protein HY449_00755 [Candidatus Pacearchaeota archaeon]|nr:hypothetical protein [Candidatus Pacearchaeota archaeon]